MGMADIPVAKLLIYGLVQRKGRILAANEFGQKLEKFIQCGSLAGGDVETLIEGVRVLGGRGQQICLHDVFDEAEVAAGFAIAIDDNALAFQKS